jgi:hypothetical protein
MDFQLRKSKNRSRIIFERRKISTAEIEVKKSNDDVIRSLAHSLAVEIDSLPYLLSIVFNWCILDKSYILNSSRKSWLTYQTTTPLLV